LGLEDRPDAVERPLELVERERGQQPRRLPLYTKVVKVFDRYTGALLILGAPGAGKTTLLLELARDLIDRTESDEAQLIPVVFNLSSWAVHRHKLTEWLVEELNQRYDVPAKLGQHWVSADQILPLLDGLDEVAPEYREGCVQHINDFRTEHGLVPIVICSRVIEYESLTTRLRLPGAVIVEPLARSQVQGYLNRAGNQLKAVREALAADSVLWDLLDTPLMLNITMLAYQGAEPSDIPVAGTLSERRDRLFAEYIDAMFRHRVRAPRYTQDQTVPWLAWLASSMGHHNQSIFRLENLGPDWLQTRAQRWICKVVLATVTTSALGLALWLGAHVFLGSMLSSVGVLPSLVLLALLLGYGQTFKLLFLAIFLGVQLRPVDAMSFRLDTQIPHDPAQLFSRPASDLLWRVCMVVVFWNAFLSYLSRFGTSLVPGQRYGLRVVLLSFWAMIFSLPVLTMLNLLFHAILVGTVWSLGIFLVDIFARAFMTGEVTWRSSPNDAIHRSARHSILIWLACSLLVGLAGVPAALVASHYLPMIGGAISWLFRGMAFGFGIGAFFALWKGGAFCIQHLVIRVELWRQHSVPWNYTRFLDYAAEQNFLRKVGGGYIFVHQMLRDYFATQYRPQRS
jgi:DNA polymerase III delta prime subunit